MALQIYEHFPMTSTPLEFRINILSEWDECFGRKTAKMRSINGDITSMLLWMLIQPILIWSEQLKLKFITSLSPVLKIGPWLKALSTWVGFDWLIYCKLGKMLQSGRLLLAKIHKHISITEAVVKLKGPWSFGSIVRSAQLSTGAFW